jgi:hypothetical protein
LLNKFNVNQQQLKQHEANESRFVTKVRWIIESRNGHIENFRALGEVNNKSLSLIMQDYRIVAAIINCSFCKLKSDRDNEKEIVTEMKKKIWRKSHSLEKYFNGFQKSSFLKIDANNARKGMNNLLF